MTEKIGTIKNPLTIIAIFAGIAEVSGTVVLPFIAETNQEKFIWFLISFPTILVILFFMTLNWNNKVLYAPSDYKDEANYININRYDYLQQKNIEVKVPIDNPNNQQLIQISERLELLTSQAFKIEERSSNKSFPTVDNELEKFVDKTYGSIFRVTNFRNVSAFLKYMADRNILFEIYESPRTDTELGFPENRAIWLGNQVPLKLAQFVIKHSKLFYPHLKYIQVSERNDEDVSDIYIGGSTKSAKEYFKLSPLSPEDFSKLEEFNDIESFQNFIQTFSK